MTTANDKPGADRHERRREVPRVWVLLGHRVGDNLQLGALADALGWPHEDKILDWRRPLPRWSPWYGRRAGLKHLTAEASAALAPPWPDLVLSIGWRSVPAARWIRRQGGARLVHLGRPRAPLSAFDLVLTTPQYRLPASGNVRRLDGPISPLTPERLAAAARLWEPRLSHLPRPWTVVLIGGDAPPLRLPPATAASLADACNRLAAEQGGSLLVTTGPRTPPQSAATFRSRLAAASYWHDWHSAGENPYAGFLALADRFVLTNDSVSMAHEAAARGRPLHVFPLPVTGGFLRARLRRTLDNLQRADAPMHRAYHDLIRAGLIYPPRSADDYFNGLIESGRANLLGDPEVSPADAPGPGDCARAVDEIRALFPGQGGASG